MAEKQKGRKKDRQRKSAQNTRYKNEHRREQNKLTRLRRHLKKFPNDEVAIQAAKLASATLGKTFKLAA